MVAFSFAPGSFEKYLFYFIQSKSVEYLLEPVYVFQNPLDIKMMIFPGPYYDVNVTDTLASTESDLFGPNYQLYYGLEVAFVTSGFLIGITINLLLGKTVFPISK